MRTVATAAVIVSLAVMGCSSSGKGEGSATPATTPPTTSDLGLRTPASVKSGRVSLASAPDGIAVPRARWLDMMRPDGKTQRVAVLRPADFARHPVIVYLHGASGLAEAQLQWAQKLADTGFLVVAGCYLDVDPAAPRPTSHTWVPCPGLPDQEHADASTFNHAYQALLDTAEALDKVAEPPGAKPEPIGVFGVSLGAIFSLTTSDPRLKAIAADSGFGNEGTGVVRTPVLLLGMTNDPNVPHAKVVAFEQALRAAGKPVESHYYAGRGHVVTLAPNTISDDATRRVATFFHTHLG
jgi:dienelactone hydrolase